MSTLEIVFLTTLITLSLSSLTDFFCRDDYEVSVAIRVVSTIIFGIFLLGWAICTQVK